MCMQWAHAFLVGVSSAQRFSIGAFIVITACLEYGIVVVIVGISLPTTTFIYSMHGNQFWTDALDSDICERVSNCESFASEIIGFTSASCRFRRYALVDGRYMIA